MKLEQLEKRGGVGKKEFKEQYLEPRTPLVLTDVAKEWPAIKKWSFDYLIEKHGAMTVPVCDNSFRKPGKKYLANDMEKMPFAKYLNIIKEKPTDLRIFLFNALKNAPELAEDIRVPDIMDGVLKEMPFMFFGGQGSQVGLHYDLDCAHVFLTQFQTRKRVVLFSPEQSTALYQHPYTVQSQVDINNPDYNQYPAAKNIEGYETILEHGETLYIPSRYWHYIEYVDAGFSLAFRAFESFGARLGGIGNILRNYVVDKGMNSLLGSRWYQIKENMARKKASLLFDQAA